jgi:hypothetical protein
MRLKVRLAAIIKTKMIFEILLDIVLKSLFKKENNHANINKRHMK